MRSPGKPGEEGAEMIKFLCDLCGKDISGKVHDSVKQFCGRTHFSPELRRPTMGDGLSQKQNTRHNVELEQEPVQLDFQVLAELSRLIHASAWGIHSPRIYCSSCARRSSHADGSKVVNIFTRVNGEQRSAEIP